VTRVIDLLALARRLGVERLDAHLLLCHVLQRPRSWLLAHDDLELAGAQRESAEALLQRRAQGEPLAYLTGEKEFHGLMLHVTPAVLIPRPDTETLVDWALELLAERAQPVRVLDMGTGSGAIALAVKRAQPGANVTALDASRAALAIAEANASRHGLDVRWRLGDWWDAVAAERFDLVLGNPPYIAEADPHLAALKHEPGLALTSGEDGLCALRTIVAGAPPHLTTGGWLLLEHGFDQNEAVQALLRAQGFSAVQTRCDLAGIPRCTGGQWR
jgi:release factor glutamine methyltransferase